MIKTRLCCLISNYTNFCSQGVLDKRLTDRQKIYLGNYFKIEILLNFVCFKILFIEAEMFHPYVIITY